MKRIVIKRKIQENGRNIILLLMVMMLFVSSCGVRNGKKYETVSVKRGSIAAGIPSTGIVMPRNRLEIKPPVAGRIDEVLIQEGQNVKKGDTLAWMSSSDRAALLDAARSKGKDETKYWEDVYKATPIVAPLSGFIIQRSVEPGQSVAVSDPILVMADRLIIKAQVDETDLGRIKLDQNVNIIMDAYPGINIKGHVGHIAYESKLINNVNIYEVDVLPDTVPSFLRSGMSATVNFYQEEKDGVLLLPSKAVKKTENTSYVFINKNGKIEAIQVKTGLESSNMIEIISGISEEAQVIIPTAKIIQDTMERLRGHGQMGLPGMRR